MGSQVFMGRNTAGKHGFCLFPILFDEHGKIDVSEEAGNQSGREEAMKEAAIKDEVPTQAQKGEGKEAPERLPDDESSQGQEEEVSRDQPMKKDLAWMVFA
jgi:hypothetical protein